MVFRRTLICCWNPTLCWLCFRIPREKAYWTTVFHIKNQQYILFSTFSKQHHRLGKQDKENTTFRNREGLKRFVLKEEDWIICYGIGALVLKRRIQYFLEWELYNVFSLKKRRIHLLFYGIGAIFLNGRVHLLFGPKWLLILSNNSHKVIVTDDFFL